MKFPYNTKAIVGALIGAIAPVATDVATNPQGVTTSTGVASLIAAVVGYIATYEARNGAKPATSVSGYNLALQLDPQAFLASVETDTPELLARAVKAALGQPAEAPVASPDILGKAAVVEPPAASDMIGGTPSAPVAGTGV